MEKIKPFLECMKNSDINSAYSLLLEDFGDDETNALARIFQSVLTSHFIRQRSGKMNALLNLKRTGFNPVLVIDVGAQIGTPELYQAFPDAQHIFIEPVIECIPTLEHIASDLKSATIYNCAISNINGVTELSVTDSKQYASIDENIGAEIRTIEVRTVDSIIEDFPKINGSILLKIDVDGPEIKVLQGSKSLFNQDCIIVIEASMADENPRFSRVVEYLSAYGYEVYDIVDPLYRQSDWHLWQVDLIFIKKGSPIWGSKIYT
jgi:FkbM family methyltransferase